MRWHHKKVFVRRQAHFHVCFVLIQNLLVFYVHLLLDGISFVRFIGGKIPEDQACLIGQEAHQNTPNHGQKQHDGDHAAVPLEKVRPRIFPARHLAVVGLLHQECHAKPRTIRTQVHRGRQEEQEPSHVPFSHATVEPHAVVVEPGHTSIAHAAVFGPGWFFRFACAAIASRHVQQSVERVCALRLASRRVFEHAWIDEARHDERHQHQGDASRCQPSMPRWMFPAILQLQQRVSGVHPCAIHHADQQEEADR
mmetsp:Transcript_7872/g.48712  ORF Transcript_7872/g.48712 Transcript_7872/m.48712 type:complete len:253 (+) Transcript_7872:568-1326(+)